MFTQSIFTLVLAFGTAFVSVWALFKYVITMEMRLEPAIFKHIYSSLDVSTFKVIFSEEIKIENRSALEFSAILKYKESPYFYVNHGERLLNAGWQGKDQTTRIVFMRWQYKKLRKFLKDLCDYTINHRPEMPVYVLTPHYVDNIGKIKCKSIVPIQPKSIWKDIEEQIELCIEEEDKKLGLILHGKPGNGKTSFIKYVSEKYKLPTYYITFSPEYDNIHLMIMFSQIPARSLVILEDFDSYFDKRTCVMQNSTNGINAPKFTFDTILNSLDGVYNSFDKNIFILTANDVNKIDDSLKHRPSRFKIVREFPDPTRDIINNFVPEPWNKHVSAVNYDQLIRIAEFKNQGYTITKTFEMLSLPLPQEVFNIAQKIYEDRLINNIDGNADSDFLKACQQFDEMNK
jgi:hypothetical protein